MSKCSKTKTNYTNYSHTPVLNSIYLENVEPNQVTDIINKLKPKNSSGHDNISTKFVKASIVNIINPFTHIINLSLNSGIFPDELKIAKVIPVFKSSEADKLQNDWPISLLPAISKVFEKIMYNKIVSFLSSKNILYKHQYGFRQKHSTIHPIIHMLNDCAKNINAAPNNTPFPYSVIFQKRLM